MSYLKLPLSILNVDSNKVNTFKVWTFHIRDVFGTNYFLHEGAQQWLGSLMMRIVDSIFAFHIKNMHRNTSTQFPDVDSMLDVSKFARLLYSDA